ncbi:MAG: hypothetical protein P0116_09540 [Candidatus Nitrosocosmicus sp.]|nr:hypothetical protein [Candidatus Nitrosocosmicus sp.]
MELQKVYLPWIDKKLKKSNKRYFKNIGIKWIRKRHIRALSEENNNVSFWQGID